MITKDVRDLSSDKATGPKFCNVIVDDNGAVFLEQKVTARNGRGKSQLFRIRWEDVEYQVNAAKEAFKRVKLEATATSLA